MSEVASAVAWIKFDPELPFLITAEAEDQISFRVFNDVYTITRTDQNYKIVRDRYFRWFHKMGEEITTLDALTVEKVLKFVNAKSRAEAILNSDLFKSSMREQKLPAGFQASKSIFQCKSDLPARNQDGSIVYQILQHTWIQNGVDESFGMPNTDEATYFGGRAHIRTPDSFIGRGPKHLECSPVWFSSDQDEKVLSKKVACVARSLSLPQNPVFDSAILNQPWVAHFDYHALERNCLLATRFVLECAGANPSQVVNAGIGGKFNWFDLYSVSEISAELKNAILGLRAQLKMIRDQEVLADLQSSTEKLMNQALDLDSRIRGVTGDSRKKTLHEICDLALDRCN